MKEWLLSVGVVIVILSILKIILPNGKTKKTVFLIFGLISALVFIKPLLSLKNESADFEFILEKNVSYQEDYIYYVYEKEIEIKKQNLKNKLNDLGVKKPEIDTFYSLDTKYVLHFEKIIVNLNNSVILSENKHIDIIEETKKATMEIFNVNSGDLIINE